LFGLRHGEALGIDDDRFRRAHVTLGELPHWIRQGGGKQRRLAFDRRLLQDRLDVLDEPHAQHLVRFVEHQVAHRAEIQHPPVDQIEHPSRRAHDHIHAAFQPADLPIVGLTAVDSEHAHPPQASIVVDGFGDLQRQLAGGGEDQSLDAVRVGLEPVQQRQRKGGRLAGAGLRLPQNIAPGEQRGNRPLLDGSGNFVAQVSHRLQHLGVQIEHLKIVTHGVLLNPCAFHKKRPHQDWQGLTLRLFVCLLKVALQRTGRDYTTDG